MPRKVRSKRRHTARTALLVPARLRNKRTIVNLLEEVSHRLKALGLPENEELVIEAYRPGHKTVYRLSLKHKETGAIIPWSSWMSKEALVEALKFAVNVLRFITSHK